MRAFAAGFCLDLLRFRRSRGIWFLLLLGPLAARFWIPREDGTAFTVSIGGASPILTPSFVGLALGIATSTIFVPLFWIYLRSNVNNRQPWQLQITAPNLFPLSLGRYFADLAVIALIMVTLSAVGVLVCLFRVGTSNLKDIMSPLWFLGFPALATCASLKLLCEAVPSTRRSLGDALFLCLWVASLMGPIVEARSSPGFLGALADFSGLMRPLAGGGVAIPKGLAVGIMPVGSGHVAIDVQAGMRSTGFVTSRIAWIGIAFIVAVIGSLNYNPVRAREPIRRAGARSGQGQTAPRLGNNVGARSATSLIWAEFRALFLGRSIRYGFAACVALGCFRATPQLAITAFFLLTTFSFTAHSGRWASATLTPLVATMPAGLRRRAMAVVLAAALGGGGTALAPLLLYRDYSLFLVAVVGAGGLALLSGLIATTTRSAVPARILLLAAWYIYVSR